MSSTDAGLRDEVFSGVLAAAQTGASWALSDLWCRYSPAVLAFLTARGSDEPEDLTSEVFMAVFDALPRFTGGESELRSFVFTIAYRRLTDELRMRSRRGRTVEWVDEGDPRRAPSAEQGALHSIGDAETRKILDQLPPDQRDVLVLRIIGDLTIDEIAEIVGKRPGAVKALQRRGLEALRRKLSPTRTPATLSSDSRE
ncbi:MAG: polymerase sigma-70 factor [Naasia sp.]|jgi:RNA polymerase sigma factor (sigma-70 family)|uniref:RNA polymerase sigma factor n=1 Tax=Naasia sp. TaxID=2546198 RepID=UPI0026251FA7|nr:sigma-70 family RNA polymerase sigma factor [Naasia sp.]MCU1571529.1 polymerase sigma-70 factor [Naasia sp.]